MLSLPRARSFVLAASTLEELATIARDLDLPPVEWAGSATPNDISAGPGILAPVAVRAAFNSLSACGVPLARTRLGSPLPGVKCPSSKAFLVTRVDGRGSSCWVHNSDNAGEIEHAMLRPAIGGEHVAAWLTSKSATHIVWTHGPDGNPLRSLPPGATRWLQPYRARLDAHPDARGSDRWWSLLWTDGAACDRPRVVWASVGKAPRVAVLDAGDDVVPLDDCYVLKCRDRDEALTLAAVLNSDLVSAWLQLLAGPAPSGHYRHLAWTMPLLPLPRDWTTACAMLPQVAERAMNGAVDSRDLLDAVLRAYGMRLADVAALLGWTEGRAPPGIARGLSPL